MRFFAAILFAAAGSFVRSVAVDVSTRDVAQGSTTPSESIVTRATHNTGEATYYAPGLGSCGRYNGDNDMIVAVSASFFDSFPGATANPNRNPVCGRRMSVAYKGKAVTVTVVDRCPGCSKYSLDLSPAAFNVLSHPDAGRLKGVTWTMA